MFIHGVKQVYGLYAYAYNLILNPGVGLERETLTCRLKMYLIFDDNYHCLPLCSFSGNTHIDRVSPAGQSSTLPRQLPELSPMSM